MEQYFIQLAKAVGVQIFGLFGLFFIFGFVLSKLQEWTQRNYARSVGWKGILWTAWFGTPFHEYGHAFFAKLFRHKIDSMALFKPNPETGELGFVNHSYNPKSFYQSIGNFFIGAAPMIFGSLILVFFLYLLVPNSSDIFGSLANNQENFLGILKGAGNALLKLFTLENIKTWYFWIFLYMSFCVASHIAPSKADRKGLWKGLILIIISLVFINILTLLIKWDITQYILTFSEWLSILVAIFAYATIISLLHFIASYFILRPFRKY